MNSQLKKIIVIIKTTQAEAVSYLLFTSKIVPHFLLFCAYCYPFLHFRSLIHEFIKVSQFLSSFLTVSTLYKLVRLVIKLSLCLGTLMRWILRPHLASEIVHSRGIFTPFWSVSLQDENWHILMNVIFFWFRMKAL